MSDLLASFCDFCNGELGKKRPPVTRLVFVNDGYGNYFAFDSEKCAFSYIKKFGKNLEGMGTRSYEECSVLEKKLQTILGWSVSWTSIKILEERIKRGDDKDIYEEFD